ncbi:hypothetical protein NXX53_06880 [Bacteroides salyersiae]|nr:hypothetical protein [Bacteroides salyersiae]
MKNKAKVVCSFCGSENVTCQAIVNPNTEEIKDFTCMSFYDGYCENCSDTVLLTQPEEVQKEIRQKLEEFTGNDNPRFAVCDIIDKDRNHVSKVKMGIRSLNPNFNNNECYWVCGDMDELEALCIPSTVKITVIRCFTFQ